MITEVLGEYKLPFSSGNKVWGATQKGAHHLRNQKWAQQISRGSFKLKEFLRNTPYGFSFQITTFKFKSKH